MPAAARVSDKHVCQDEKPARPGGGPIVPHGEPTVLIGFKPAARAGDGVRCAAGATVIAGGEPTVLIGEQEAARIGDPTGDGGAIVSGCRTVLIGASVVADALRDASTKGTPLCKDRAAGAAGKRERRKRRR
jgi:uncharacterized Zn-binding protein involved in type VI secretion